MKRKVKKIIFLTVSFLLAFFVLSNVASYITYSIMFKRVKDIDYNISTRLTYEDYKDVMPRVEYKYKSKEETLCGYYYHNNDNAPLIVFSSGYNDVSDSLIPYHKRFYDLGYNIFSYDGSGCGKSSGTQNGFYQSLIDLESTLRFIDQKEELTNLPLMLFGYSAGGFACTAIFNIDDFDVLASVSISGYNDANQLLIEKGKDYAGFFSYLGRPTMDAIVSNRFKDYMSYTAVDGINKSNIPFYIFHGRQDEVIDLKELSIYYKQNVISNRKVVFRAFDDKNHTNILFNSNKDNYREFVDRTLKEKTTYEEKVEFISTINRELYNFVNYKIVDEAHMLYQSVI